MFIVVILELEIAEEEERLNCLLLLFCMPQDC